MRRGLAQVPRAAIREGMGVKQLRPCSLAGEVEGRLAASSSKRQADCFLTTMKDVSEFSSPCPVGFVGVTTAPFLHPSTTCYFSLLSLLFTSSFWWGGVQRWGGSDKYKSVLQSDWRQALCLCLSKSCRTDTRAVVASQTEYRSLEDCAHQPSVETTGVLKHLVTSGNHFLIV